MRKTETDNSRGNPYKVKPSFSLYDKYYLHSLHYHTYEHELIVRLQPLVIKVAVMSPLWDIITGQRFMMTRVARWVLERVQGYLRGIVGSNLH
jgi:hypothetical protein